MLIWAPPQTAESADSQCKLGPFSSWVCSQANHVLSLGPAQVLGSSLAQLGSEWVRGMKRQPLANEKGKCGSAGRCDHERALAGGFLWARSSRSTLGYIGFEFQRQPSRDQPKE